MSVQITNATPRPILKGMNDVSAREPVYDPELLPTHLAHVFTFAERGSTIPELVSGITMTEMYGSRSFDYKGPYVTHQTVLANTLNAEGNAVMLHRLVPPGANPPSSLRLSIDIVPEFIPTYERDISGKFMIDALDQKIPTGNVVPGYNAKWVITPTIDTIDDGRLLENGDPRLLENGNSRVLESRIGDGSTSVGTMSNDAGDPSTLYPILDFEAKDFGSDGDNLGIRFSSPTIDTDIAIDDITVEEQAAYLYRLQIMRRDDVTKSTKVLTTLAGEQYVDFSLKEGVFNSRTSKELFLDDVVTPSFELEAQGGMPEIRGPLNEVHLYSTNLDTVLNMIHVSESPHGFGPTDIEDKHLLNIFGGHTHLNIPYESLVIKGPADGGILLSKSATHFCQGGYDGVMNLSTFDLGVRDVVANYGVGEVPLTDMALYPQSCIYDTGFAIETKKAMMKVVGARKDMYVVACCQDVMLPQNTASQESSIGVALRTAARLYPESEIYGTSTCRVIILKGSGFLINSGYKDLLPLTVEFAQKCARYMGAGTGFWDPNRAFDVKPNNHITMFKGVNTAQRPLNARSSDWNTGLVWAENYNRRSQFWPAFQTVYDDDTSVLNSAINMIIAVELEKVAYRSWRDISGNGTFKTPAQFIEASNELIEADVEGKFDNRVVVEADTYMTPDDSQRGYSYSCNIIMYGPDNRTVGSYTITADNLANLPG